jgi:hypothetical protein
MSKRVWFYTFTVLDASGAISSSQLERLMAPLKRLYGKLFHRSGA